MIVLYSVCCALFLIAACLLAGYYLARAFLYMERNHRGWDHGCFAVVMMTIVFSVLAWCFYTILSNL